MFYVAGYPVTLLSSEVSTHDKLALLKLSSSTPGSLHVCLAAQTDADRHSIRPVIKALGKHITTDLHIDPLDPPKPRPMFGIA